MSDDYDEDEEISGEEEPENKVLNSDDLNPDNKPIEEGHENQDDGESDSDDDSSESELEKEEVDQTKKKSRIITAFVDSDDESNNPVPIIDQKLVSPLKESDNDIKLTQPSSGINTQPSQDFFRSQSDYFTDFTEPSVSERDYTESMKILFDPSSQCLNTDLNRSVDDELLDICSGQFLPTQSQAPGFSKTAVTAFTEGLFTQTLNEEDNNELMEICSGPFITQRENVKVIIFKLS